MNKLIKARMEEIKKQFEELTEENNKLNTRLLQIRDAQQNLNGRYTELEELLKKIPKKSQ